MNTYGVILLIFCILTVLYWILSIADKCIKAGGKPRRTSDEEEAGAFYDNETGNKKEEIEIPVKVLSFKRAMHDISNNV